MFCKSRNHFEPEGTLWVQHHLEAPVCNIICAFPNIWQQNDSYWKHMLYCFGFISKLVNNGAQITYFCLMLPVISGLCDDKWQHWLGVCVARARVCGWDLARALCCGLECVQRSEQVCCSVILWVFRRHGATEEKTLLPISTVVCVRAVDAAAAYFDAR